MRRATKKDVSKVVEDDKPQNVLEAKSEAKSEEKDFDEFTERLELLNEKKVANIIHELPGYNDERTQTFIRNLRMELDQQKTIHSIMSADDEELQKHIGNVKKFTEKYTPVVSRQLSEIRSVCEELRKIVKENKEMQRTRESIGEITKGPNYQELAQSMEDIRMQKEAIKRFLKDAGIVAPPLED